MPQSPVQSENPVSLVPMSGSSELEDSDAGIDWFDPSISFSQNRLVLPDGIHVVDSVNTVPFGISYITRCGQIVAYAGVDFLEAHLDLPRATSRECMKE
jgi:hypothetical protein